MQIYIIGSWKHQHAIEMLTAILRERGHEINSFIENNNGENPLNHSPLSFEEWVVSEDARASFEYDINATVTSDCVVYIGNSGKDAAAEIGLAFGRGIPILGLWQKGEDFGLMRRMITWSYKYTDLIGQIDSMSS